MPSFQITPGWSDLELPPSRAAVGHAQGGPLPMHTTGGSDLDSVLAQRGESVSGRIQADWWSYSREDSL